MYEFALRETAFMGRIITEYQGSNQAEHYFGLPGKSCYSKDSKGLSLAFSNCYFQLYYNRPNRLPSSVSY